MNQYGKFFIQIYKVYTNLYLYFLAISYANTGHSKIGLISVFDKPIFFK